MPTGTNGVPVNGAAPFREAAATLEEYSIATFCAVPPEIAGTIHAALKGDWQTDMIALPLRDAREVFEREYLLAQINGFSGNISRTAQFIGMERSALHRKLKSLHISTSDRDDAADTPDPQPDSPLDNPDEYGVKVVKITA